jgi:hypothetical protein
MADAIEANAEVAGARYGKDLCRGRSHGRRFERANVGDVAILRRYGERLGRMGRCDRDRICWRGR